MTFSADALLADTIGRYPALASLEMEIRHAFTLLGDTTERGHTILAAGNGGSAADAEHIVGELMKGFLLPRPMTDTERAAIARLFPDDAGRLAAGLQRGIAAVALSGANPLATAIANDTDPDLVFAQQVFALGRPGDALLAISTSGNSRNVVLATKVARARGIGVIALTGHDGGTLAGLADVAIRVPADKVHEIQELHLPVYHCLCAMLEAHFFGTVEEAAPAPSTEAVAAPVPTHADPADIDLVVFDFDGVFTDNKVTTHQDGSESVRCDRGDSLGLGMIRAAGIDTLILTKERNPVVRARGEKLGMPVVDGCDDKRTFLEGYLAERGLDPNRVAYIGNDVNDLGPMASVGLSVAPADAYPSVRARAGIVLSAKGGDGAIREFCEILLMKRGV